MSLFPFYNLRPRSIAQLGKNTTYDKSIVPWKILKLHARVEVWSADDLLMTSPCYFVTERLRDGLLDHGFTGFEIGQKLETELTDTFVNVHTYRFLPEYYLIHAIGTAGVDDFGLGIHNKLILSERVVSFLKDYNLRDAEVEEFTG